MATHSSVLAQRIPGMGEPGGLPSLGSHRVGHNWSDLAAAAETLMKHLEAQRCLITTQKHLLLGGFTSNTHTLITLRYTVLFSNSLKYMFPREVGTSIFRVWRKRIFGIYIVYVSFVGFFFFLVFIFLLISNPSNEFNPILHMYMSKIMFWTLAGLN